MVKKLKSISTATSLLIQLVARLLIAKLLIMNDYYTYAYLREDKTPYYIGKGKGRRAYRNQYRCCPTPKDHSRILILKKNLSEFDAYKHEIYMIAVLGRKDLGTGMLRNLTDGGEGGRKAGYKHTPEARKKMSEAKLGSKNPFKGKKHTLEARNKISQSRIGAKNPNYGKRLTNEQKLQLKEKRALRLKEE
jgi:hypothetical protein